MRQTTNCYYLLCLFVSVSVHCTTFFMIHQLRCPPQIMSSVRGQATEKRWIFRWIPIRQPALHLPVNAAAVAVAVTATAAALVPAMNYASANATLLRML